MAISDDETRRSGGGLLSLAVILLVFTGAAFSLAAYVFGEPGLGVVEALAAGFGGLAALILGIAGAVVGVALGLVGAIIGLVATGGAVAFTLFVIGSPVIAIILIFLLMRSGGKNCPDPDAHC